MSQCRFVENCTQAALCILKINGFKHVLDLQKSTKLSHELKSKLKPNVNDTLMHCPETSTT